MSICRWLVGLVSGRSTAGEMQDQFIPAVTFCCGHCFIAIDAEKYMIGTEISCPQCETELSVPPENQEFVAKDILRDAKLMSTMSITSFDQCMPELWDICSSEDWVYFGTAAIIACSLMLEEDGQLRVWKIESILKQLSEMDPEAYRAVDDFIKSWLRMVDNLKPEEHVSMWLLTNLLQHSPSISEIKKFSHILGPFALQQAYLLKKNPSADT